MVCLPAVPTQWLSSALLSLTHLPDGEFLLLGIISADPTAPIQRGLTEGTGNTS